MLLEQLQKVSFDRNEMESLEEDLAGCGAGVSTGSAGECSGSCSVKN